MFDENLALTSPVNLVAALKTIKKPAAARDIAVLLSERLPVVFEYHLQRHGANATAINRLSAEVGTSIDYYILGEDPRLAYPQDSPSFDGRFEKIYIGRRKFYVDRKNVLDNAVYPDEISGSELWEGMKKHVVVNVYERNAKARNACIKHYGSICYVCDFNFRSVYGDLGDNFIHVHHEVDIASISESYIVNPIEDLKPVCPNCHAMLHTQRPALSITKLKEIITVHKFT